MAGTTYTDTFNVASADGTQTSVTVNILGTNDAPVLAAGGQTGSVVVHDTFVDNGQFGNFDHAVPTVFINDVPGWTVNGPAEVFDRSWTGGSLTFSAMLSGT